VLDFRKMKRKSQSDESRADKQDATPRQREYAQQQVARDADSRHRDVEKQGVRAVVHDAAIPVIVNRARLRARVVVNTQRERGHAKAGESEQNEDRTHRRKAILPDAPGG
jgi:hypothetical protein